MSKGTTWWIVGVVVAVILSFWGGTSYGKSQSASSTGQQSSGVNGQFVGGRGGMRANGGFTGGQILSVDQNSMTIGMQSGGSKVVYFSTSTEVLKSAVGSISDLSSGTIVTVTGTPEADGSITARSIQIRPGLPQSGSTSQSAGAQQ